MSCKLVQNFQHLILPRVGHESDHNLTPTRELPSFLALWQSRGPYSRLTVNTSWSSQEVLTSSTSLGPFLDSKTFLKNVACIQ